MAGLPPLPACVWRGETGHVPPPGRSAAEVLRFEARQGLRLDIGPATWAALEAVSAALLIWVCFSRATAARYGDPQEIALNDAPAVILATDDNGGFLLLLSPLEDEDMSADDPTSRAIDLMQAEAEQITTERGQPAAAHYQQHREAFVSRQAELNSSAVGSSPAEIEPLQTEYDARKHDYAAFLAERLSEFHGRIGNPERADDFAAVHDVHVFKAAELREGNGVEPPPTQDQERFEPSSWHPGDYVPSDGQRAEMLGILRNEPPEASVQAVLRDEHDEFSHTPVEGPVTEALHVLWHSNIHGEQYPETFGEVRATLDRHYGRGPEDDPDKPKGNGPAPDFAETAFVLLERGANGAQAETMSAHLFIDREQAGEAARGFPASQEDAARQGMSTWAEVHPVTPAFAANFAEMEQAGRLETIAALYSTAREVDHQLVPADPREPGAVRGEFREGGAELDAAPDFRALNVPTAALSQNAYEIDVGIGPGGMTTTITNRAQRDLSGAPDSAQEAPTRPGEVREEAPANAWEAIRAEAKAEFSPDRQPGRYAELEAITARAPEDHLNLAEIAASRDVRGEAPSERIILTRQAEESTQRQAAELAASKGEDRPANAPANAWETIRAEAKAEVTERASCDAPAQEAGRDRGEGFSAGPAMV